MTDPRCPARSPGGVHTDGTLPRKGTQCGLPKGHTGDHTILIPTGAPWFPQRSIPDPPAASAEQIAERIAREAHAGQTDKSGSPYIEHVERVVAAVYGDDQRTVAWLHDVVEDNPAWTFERLKQEGIPTRLIRAVSMLTRRPPYTYADYIEDIKSGGDDLAMAVKIADLRDHLRPNCPAGLRPRYETALISLSVAEGGTREPKEKAMTFDRELESLLNRHSMETASDTPDFILAHFLLSCLVAWNQSTQQREAWYGRDARPSVAAVAPTEEPS